MLILCLLIQNFLSAAHIEWDIERYGFRKVSDAPEIYVADNFLTDNECAHIIDKARPTLARSTVVDSGSSKGVVDTSRTSLGTFLSDSNDVVIKRLRNKIETITLIPSRNGEGIQVLNYKVGAEYKPHFDFFNPKTKGGSYHLNRGGQRVATCLFYLNTPDQGGETVFPKAPLRVRAIKNRAVLFYNVRDNGTTDPNSLHGGLPVLAGEKWIATLWLREGEFH